MSPLNIADAESSYSYGRMQWMEFLEEFEARWQIPLGEMQMGMLLKGITDDERAQIANPENLDNIERLFARMTGEGG